MNLLLKRYQDNLHIESLKVKRYKNELELLLLQYPFINETLQPQVLTIMLTIKDQLRDANNNCLFYMQNIQSLKSPK